LNKIYYYSSTINKFPLFEIYSFLPIISQEVKVKVLEISSVLDFAFWDNECPPNMDCLVLPKPTIDRNLVQITKASNTLSANVERRLLAFVFS